MKVEPVFCSVIVTGVISSAHENDHHERSRVPRIRRPSTSCGNYEQLNHSNDEDETQNDVANNLA